MGSLLRNLKGPALFSASSLVCSLGHRAAELIGLVAVELGVAFWGQSQYSGVLSER